MRAGVSSRIVRFQVVGALGVLVQMGSVIAFHEGLGFSAMMATAAAVEGSFRKQPDSQDWKSAGQNWRHSR